MADCNIPIVCIPLNVVVPVFCAPSVSLYVTLLAPFFDVGVKPSEAYVVEIVVEDDVVGAKADNKVKSDNKP